MVVNCFQISIFAVHEQHEPIRYKISDVVNCFQISIFAVHEQLGGRLSSCDHSCELLSN